MKSKAIEVFINVIFWLASGWLVVNSLSVSGQEVTVENGVETVTYIRDDQILRGLILVVLLSMISFYGNLLNILKHYTRRKAWVTVLIGAILLAFPVIITRMLEQTDFKTAYLIPATFEFGIHLFYFSASTGYGLTKLFLRSEASKKSLLVEKKQAELSLLRSQLHPHFLFNALNNLLSMVDQQRDPRLAEALDKLSGLLRYVVYDTEVESVAVGKEIEFIEAYAQLHQLRFDESELDFNLQILGENLENPIEPGILVPFVENAFKYGALPEEKSEISVILDLRKQDVIGFRCSNPIFQELQRKDGNGTGLKHARERLKLAYHGRHHLKVNDARDDYVVELQIDAL